MMTAVFKREFSSIFRHPFAYVYLAVFTFASGLFVWLLNMTENGSPVEYTAIWFAFFLTVLMPFCAFPSVYRDRKKGTDRILFDLPLSDASVFWGKTLAVLCVPALGFVPLLLWLLIFWGLGSLHVATAFAVLFALFLLAFFFASVSTLIAWNFQNLWGALGFYEVIAAFSIVIYLLYKKLPEPVSAFSPFYFLHRMIIGSFDWIWCVCLLLASVILMVISSFTFGRQRKEFLYETNF